MKFEKLQEKNNGNKNKRRIKTGKEGIKMKNYYGANHIMIYIKKE